MFAIVEAKPDQNKARFLVDTRKRNDNTVRNNIPVPDITNILNTLVSFPCRSMVDMKDTYFKTRISPELEQYNTYTTPFGTLRNRVMIQGDCYAVAT